MIKDAKDKIEDDLLKDRQKILKILNCDTKAPLKISKNCLSVVFGFLEFREVFQLI